MLCCLSGAAGPGTSTGNVRLPRPSDLNSNLSLSKDSGGSDPGQAGTDVGPEEPILISEVSIKQEGIYHAC